MNFNHWQKVGIALDKACVDVPRKTAFDIQANAQAHVAVDTSFLKNSIYTITSEKGRTTSTVDASGSRQRVAKTGFRSTRRKRIKKSKQALMLPEIPPPPDDYTAYTVVGASYGIYLEYGTTRMPARPYFYSAIDAAKPGFDAAMAKIEEKLREAAK